MLERLLDEEGLMSRSENDIEFVGELLEMFVNSLPNYYETIEKSIQEKDNESLRKTSHKLKGAITSMGGEFTRTIAYELENMGKQSNFTNASQTLDKLKESNNQLILAIRQMIANHQK